MSSGKPPWRPIARALRRIRRWFLAIFLFKFAMGFVMFSGKGWLGAGFLAAYALYVWKELGADGDLHDSEALERAEIPAAGRRARLFWAALQTGAALIVVFAASRIFVSQLGALGPALGVPTQLAALLLSPIATEMPETVNAIIWVRQGKEAAGAGQYQRRDDDPGDDPHRLRPHLDALAVRPCAGRRRPRHHPGDGIALLDVSRGRGDREKLSRSSLLYLVFAGALLVR